MDTESMMMEIRHFGLRRVERVIVLGGRGKVFSAGADLEWMKAVAEFGHENNVREARAMSDHQSSTV